MVFTPNFEITAALTKLLMDIEASRQIVSSLPITVPVLTSLRESARLISTHYSTQIEGNRLTQEQVEDVLHGGAFPNRERDEREVKNYYQALDFLDAIIKDEAAQVSEPDVQALHGLVMDGEKRSSPYRDGQNVIKDSGSGSIVYMPPEAKDVSALMHDLIDWINDEVSKAELPVPIIAAIAHYQFATIHPYYDGNGRTARLLTNLVLHKSGYGLKGIYSLEEYYATNLQAYYKALTIGESHNYYFGREQADITGWIVYFCEGMADAFANVRLKTSEAAKGDKTDHSILLRELDQRQKQVLSLFIKSRYVTTREIAELLNIHIRTALNLCKKWIDNDFIIQHGSANKSRKYELADKWLELVWKMNRQLAATVSAASSGWEHSHFGTVFEFSLVVAPVRAPPAPVPATPVPLLSDTLLLVLGLLLVVIAVRTWRSNRAHQKILSVAILAGGLVLGSMGAEHSVATVENFVFGGESGAPCEDVVGVEYYGSPTVSNDCDTDAVVTPRIDYFANLACYDLIDGDCGELASGETCTLPSSVWKDDPPEECPQA